MRAVRRISGVLRDAWIDAGHGEGPTFPAVAPAARIDYVFVGEGVRVTQAGVATGASDASDHLPVAVDLDLNGADDSVLRA
jgi:endonuclease/exonuclease/phosphatase family metal-dependent hydrolase